MSHAQTGQTCELSLAVITPLTAVSGPSRDAHARLDLAPSFDGEIPVQVTTPASGLDGNDCGQQVAQGGMVRLVSMGPYRRVGPQSGLCRTCRRLPLSPERPARGRRQLELPVFVVEVDELGAFGARHRAGCDDFRPGCVPSVSAPRCFHSTTEMHE